MSELNNDLKAFNLCSIFLLPLTGLGIDSFGGRENFKNCFVNPEGTRLIVSIQSPEFVYDLQKYPFYLYEQGERDEEGKLIAYYVVLKFPEIWEEDFLKFYNGQYRQMSIQAKEMIRQYSCLAYHRADPLRPGGSYTDLRLLALEEDPEIYQPGVTYWEDRLGTEIPSGSQLLDPPGADEFTVLL